MTTLLAFTLPKLVLVRYGQGGAWITGWGLLALLVFGGGSASLR